MLSLKLGLSSNFVYPEHPNAGAVRTYFIPSSYSPANYLGRSSDHRYQTNADRLI